MITLNQELETLYRLNNARNRAKQLREEALYPLKAINNIDEKTGAIEWEKITINQEEIDFVRHGDKWVTSGDKVELALLVKVQNHRNISEDEDENNLGKSAKKALQKRLTDISLEELIQPIKKEARRNRSITIPVLVAARVMQSLVKRAETVFEPATMFCYYRIIRELYGVAQPNWTVGAARAGVGGTTSAFITNECLRAIFNFRNTLERTYRFFEHTHILYKNFTYLKTILEAWGIDKDKNHPLYIWADKTIEAAWLDCYLAVNPRNQEIALFLADDKDEDKNSLLLPDGDEPPNLESTGRYFTQLPERLEKALKNVFQNAAGVYQKISDYRDNAEFIERKNPIQGTQAPNFKLNDPRPRDEDGINKINRTATAHLFAAEAILNTVFNANDLLQIISNHKTTDKSKNRKTKTVYETEKILKQLSKEFYKMTRRVNRVLEPSKQYLKWVINRELAASDATFDAGELVFAATSYGAINNWRLDERLNRACEKLINSLPDNGRLPTRRPFHSDSHGYRIIPIGSEMTRALANLLQKTGYDFDACFVDRMLKMFEENSIELWESAVNAKLIAWNYKGAPEPDKPAVWVTAISVLALDRIVRMLNTRINEIVLKHFDVIKPERPHTIPLRDLIYSDYGLIEWHHKDSEHAQGKSKLSAINLQRMRAHIMRATLPKIYQGDKKNFAAIFYGPPGTGKTTLAESLALSGSVPFVKLSPSDLILQGQELLEGRAREVFEAISMLTQCVIIFDEFEPVLKSRKKEKLSTSTFKEGKSEYDIAQISGALQKISQRDDPKFRFVLGGMLPKFGKLHDIAKKQSVVYCLGTNILNDIDEAAKRPGRFDKQFPVYKPDTLSRAGILLYRLSQLTHMSEHELKNEAGQIRRFSEIVALTVNQNAEQISNSTFELKNKDNGKIAYSKYLRYIFEPTALEQEIPSKIAKEAMSKMDGDFKDLDNVEPKEKKEHYFLIKSEEKFINAVMQSGDDLTVETLGEYLNAVKMLNEDGSE